MNFIQTFVDRREQLLTALLQHIQISFIVLCLAVLTAVPLGVYLTHHKKMAEPIIQISALLQTIPALALLGLLIPLVGIGIVPAVIALFLYALLPILRNTYTGIIEVDPSLVEASKAMGMNRRKRLFKVELPIAMPIIMAGIRTATVLIIGTATLAALVGAGGLGDIILLGIDRNDNNLILLGAIPAALLAFVIDFLLRISSKLSFKNLFISSGLIFFVTLSSLLSPLLFDQKKELTIAGKLGTEPEILINMYQLLIEQDTDITVTLKPNMGKTSFVFNALKAGEIDIYPEFTGTVLETFLHENSKSASAKKVYQQAKSGLKQEYAMSYLKPMAYNNTYTLAVSKELAAKYSLKKISDLQAIQSKIKVGFTLEFNDRSDGYPGLKKNYHLNFSEIKTMEPKLRYTALQNGKIDLLDAYSTDSELQQYHLKTLEDDKNMFPPYQGAPLMMKKTAEKYPELAITLNKLAGKITAAEMRKMNYEVAVNGKSAHAVARDFLQQIGLLD